MQKNKCGDNSGGPQCHTRHKAEQMGTQLHDICKLRKLFSLLALKMGLHLGRKLFIFMRMCFMNETILRKLH